VFSRDEGCGNTDEVTREMKPEIFWIPEAREGRVAIMPRPRTGAWLEDELKEWRLAGIDIVVSLLTRAEIVKFLLEDEPRLCRDDGMEYLSFPIADREVPEFTSAAIALAKTICEHLKQAKGVAIHCRNGIGRSALIAACVLVNQGMGAQAAFEAIGRARGVDVPDTDEQKEWVEHVAKELQ